MTFLPTTLISKTSGLLLLSVLLLSSCDKPLPVPKGVINAAIKRWLPDQPGEPTDYVYGDPLISTGGFGIAGKPVYPVRAMFQISRPLPIEWDLQTGLPRLPPEWENARSYVELEFTANEFGEWSSRFRSRGWIDPEKKPAPGDPQLEDRDAFAARQQMAAEKVDFQLLERLLEESRKQDELNGGSKSHETFVREIWVSSVRIMREESRKKAEAEEERRKEEAALMERRRLEEEQERLLARKRQEEQDKRQREWEQLLRERGENQTQGSVTPLPPAPDPLIEAQVQAEVAEVLKLVNDSLMNRDGHTADEFLKMKGWSYPAKIHEAVEHALKKAEDQYAAAYGDTPQSREEFKQARKEDKVRRYRKAEQDPEFRKMRAGQPFENGYRAFHYWMPMEFDAWQKRNKK